MKEELIESIVDNITKANNIVPIIGPNVFYIELKGQKVSVQEYIVRKLLSKHFQDEATEANFQRCANGIKGMTRLAKLFIEHKMNLSRELYKLYSNDAEFLGLIKMEEEVERFLKLGKFPLILTTICSGFLETRLTFNGHEYDSISYRKEKVADGEKKQDIVLKKDKQSIEHPAIFHLFGKSDIGRLFVVTEDDLFETAHIELECPYRENQKDWKPTFIPYAKARKRIETLFSQLADQFMVIRNYAKETNGLFARIIGKISALTVFQYVNYINGKPIGRVKYALN